MKESYGGTGTHNGDFPARVGGEQTGRVKGIG